jgi:hypothetical protein
MKLTGSAQDDDFGVVLRATAEILAFRCAQARMTASSSGGEQ